jgi:hypothetical protein
VSTASIERRVSRLEGQGAPHHGLFFLLWGESEDDLSRRRAQMHLRPRDAVIAAVWSGADESPPSRWINAGTMEPREIEALVPAIERVVAVGGPSPAGAPSAEKLADEALIGIALGSASAPLVTLS